MNKSESIKELATALNKAQAEMSGAKKSSKNPFFKSNYANLEEVIHCIKGPFANNNLSYMQFPKALDGFAGVETIIMHNSGEWISNELMLKCVKNDPQGMGSAITYAKRYSLQGAIGLPSEDDDGNMATRQQAALPTPQMLQPQAQQPAPQAVYVITQKQVTRLFSIAGKSDTAQIKSILLKYGFESSKDITTDKYELICKEVEALAQQTQQTQG